MAPSRRRTRSPKLVTALVLLAVAAVVACAAIITQSVPALTGASVLGVVAGAVAVALMSAEIGVIRRTWAFDRARLADGYRSETKERHLSHMSFVEHVGSRLAWQEGQLAALQDALVTSEIETALARERLSAEKARADALEADVEAASGDLASARADLLAAQDALASSEAAGVAARAEIVAWQQVAETEPSSGQRRLA